MFFIFIRTPLQQWYSITYMYWSIIGTFITVFVGTLVSYWTASRDDTYEAKLLHPLIYKCLNFMPGERREFKQPLPTPSQDSITTSQATLGPDVITVEVQQEDKETIKGHDNFAYEKDAKKSQRINNMTSDSDVIGHLEMDEQLRAKGKKGMNGNGRRGSNKADDVFYSPQTTGVYKKYEMNC